MSFRPVVHLTAGRAVGFAVTFATPLVLVRVLNQTEFGTYKLFFLIASTLVGIAQLGMAQSLLYFLPIDPQRAARFVQNAFVILTAIGLAGFALLGIFGAHLARWLDNDALRGLAVPLGAFVLLTLPSLLLEIVLMARKQYVAAGVAYGVSDLLRAGAFVGPAVASRSLGWVLIGGVAFAAARFGATLLFMAKEFGVRLRLDTSALRAQLAYALPFHIGVVLTVLVGQLHFYAVAATVDAALYAIYAVGCLQIPLVELVFTPAGNVMMVRMQEALAARQPEAVLAAWHETTSALALIFLPLVGLLLVTAKEFIVFLFTEQYAASVPIFMIWSAAVVFATLQTDGVLRVYAKTREIAALYAIQLVLLAALILILMPAAGLAGAALAAVVTTAVGKVLALARVGGLMGAPLPELLPWRRMLEVLGAVAAAAVVALAVKSRLPATLLPTMITVGGVYLAVCFGLLMGRGHRGSEARELRFSPERDAGAKG